MNSDNRHHFAKPEGFDPLAVEQWIEGLVERDASVPAGARPAAAIVLKSLYREDAFVRNAAGLAETDVPGDWVCWLPPAGRVDASAWRRPGTLLLHPDIAAAAEEEQTFALLLQARAYAASTGDGVITP